MTIFVTKGDAPLTEAQLQKRTQKHINKDWPEWKRERSIRLGDGEFNTYMTTLSSNTDTNRANNTFNQQLADYRVATDRLAQYRLADGRAQITMESDTGEVDENDNPIMETIVVSEAIDALPAQVDVTTYDDDGNATTTTVENPLITVDNEERAAAQAVVDATPQAVKDAA